MRRADKADVDGKREARLKGQGWRTHIQRKGSKDKPEAPLSKAQAARNKRIATPCVRVEHVFGWRNSTARCCARLDWRATLYLNWKSAAYNVQRFSYLQEADIVAF